MSKSIDIARTGRSRTSPVIVLVLLLVSLMPTLAVADEWHFTGVERVVAVGDVHGAYDALVATLQNAGVIDDDLKWSGGKTHLVSTGDLLDRGAYSRRVMDLMMRLEHEAKLSGGRVHQLLGNHEVMNLIGDLRYVADEEYAAFQDFDLPEKREYWYGKFQLRMPPGIGEAAIRKEFEALAPPGYFGHRRAFASNGPYGKWLLEKPFMVVVNDTVFVHGGAPTYVVDNGIAGINTALKDDLAGYLRTSEVFMNMGVLSPIDKFKQIPGLLQPMLDAGVLTGRAAVIAEDLIALSKSPLHGPPGPTWYRGSSLCSRFVETPRLDAALAELGATRIAVGHTTTVTRRVEQRLNGRVIQMDTGMLNEVYGGSGNALLIESGVVKVINQSGAEEITPLEHPLQVGFEDATLSERDYARTLEKGDISAVVANGADWQLVKVVDGPIELLAAFRALPGETNFAPELAAYRLDRQLQLGMVPVTVRRTIDDRPGTLQFVPGVTLTERERAASGRGGDAYCALTMQQGAMLVFDALILNAARTPSSMVYDSGEWELMLIDHENAFDADTELPTDLPGDGLAVSDEWRVALSALDDDVLRTVLGDALDDERLAALGKRRDALIAHGD